jgi:hypothetical protein
MLEGRTLHDAGCAFYFPCTRHEMRVTCVLADNRSLSRRGSPLSKYLRAHDGAIVRFLLFGAEAVNNPVRTGCGRTLWVPIP